jgi:hypothetical protein
MEFDTGGTGKGLAADLVATLVGHDERFAIDCGADTPAVARNNASPSRPATSSEGRAPGVSPR